MSGFEQAHSRSVLNMPRAAVVGSVAALAVLLTGCGDGEGNTRVGPATSLESETSNPPLPAITPRVPTPGETLPANELPMIRFNYLHSNSKTIQVYKGPGTATEDGKVTGAYEDNELHQVDCQVPDGRTVFSQGKESKRQSPLWYRLTPPLNQLNQPPQYASATYADYENMAVPLPLC